MASAVTPKGNKLGRFWLNPFFGAVLAGSILFLASGIIAQFGDAKFLARQDLAFVFIALAMTEFLFRGFLADRLGLLKSSVLFTVLATIVFSSVAPSLEPITALRLLIYFLLYSATMSVLKMREDVWACALGAMVYFAFVLISRSSPYFASIVLSLSLLLFALYWRMRWKTLGEAIGEFGISKDNLLRNIAIGVFATVFLFIALSVIVLALGPQQGALQSDMKGVRTKVLEFPDFMVYYAVTMAPFSEEIFFRGFLFPAIGLFLSSALFAVSHITYGSWSEIAAAFFIAAFYCWLCKKTGSLIPAIVSHAIFNAVSLAVTRSMM